MKIRRLALGTALLALATAAPIVASAAAVSTAAAHGGTASLLTTGRTAAWNGPSRTLSYLHTSRWGVVRLVRR
jgi:hypothetical protein